MNKKTGLLIIVVLAAITSLVPTAHSQNDDKNKQLAKRLIQSASVKKGDVVVISGGKHMIPLMEAVAIEVQLAGAFANMWLTSDKVQRAIFTEEPEEFLGQMNYYSYEWLGRANAVITLPAFEDSVKLTDGVPPARLAKVAGPNEDMTSRLNALPVRWVSLNLPDPGAAKLLGVDVNAMQKMTWDGINADYAAISAKAMKLKSILQSGKLVHVTSPAGTDFTFTLVPGRMVLVNDGIVTNEEAKSSLLLDRFATLPTGEIVVAPLETSANGRVSVSKDHGRDGMIRNTKFEFRNGKVENYTAATNAKTFIEEIAPYSGPKDVIGYFSIGLNSAMKAMDAGDENWFPSQAEGMVSIGVGDNKLMGGENLTSGGWGWSIPNATVTVDGKTIIKDGRPVF